MFTKLPKLIRFLLLLIAVEIVLFSLLRVAFFIAFKDYGSDYTAEDILFSFWIGFRFDMQLILIANLPILLFGGLKYIGLFKSTFGKYFWTLYILFTWVFILLIYIIDFPYFDFFKKMVDSSIVRYVYDLGEAFKMLLEGYPLIPSLIAFVLVLLFVFWGLLKLLTAMAEGVDVFASTKQKVMVYGLFSLLYIFGGYGKFEMYPWRWSEAFYSSNSFLSYLSSNPVTYFVNTLKNKDVKYDLNATRSYYPAVATFLDVNPKDENNVSLVRVLTPKHSETYTFNKPNIVFILGESTSYARSSISGNPLNPTPFLKEMSDEGLTYSRFYTPHAGTARSVWASMTGLPDVERMKTSSRNPMAVQEHMILNSLEGYEKHYFIGGSLSWGNVRGVVGNVDGIHMHEEQDYPDSPHNDVWGISDVHLADEVNAVFKKQKKAFFAFVQLSGNHSPNTIPDENYGFEHSKGITKEELLKYSFDGKINELDGQRFLDHSVKHLITLAKKEAYFKNTIFIFIGDHGLTRRGDHMHEAEQTYRTATIHTPLIVYAPYLMKHQSFDYPVSEVDIMATIAGLTGSTYVNATMGRDLLAENFEKKKHYAFYIEHGNNPLISLMAKEYIFRIRANGEERQLYKYYYDKKDENLIEKEPKLAKEMEEVCRGIFESTRYTRFHNDPKSVKKRLSEID